MFEVKSTNGDTFLGGEDFDIHIVDFLADEFKKEQGIDLRDDKLGLHGARQLDLGLFRRFLEALERELVLAQVDALLLLELIGEIVDDALVEVFAAEESVAVGRAKTSTASA